jgi:uncharacterized protein YdhG (YjbR/CyaY superfamily)
MSRNPPSVDEYIAGFPPEIRSRLEAVRAAVLAAVPDGEERISYKMPAVFRAGVVIYYAAFKNHIGVYPPVSDPAVRSKVARYAGPKGNLQFPHTEPLPLTLLADVAMARAAANVEKSSVQKLRKPGRSGTAGGA